MQDLRLKFTPIKRLRFPGPLEQQFIEFYNQEILGHLRVSAAFGITIYWIFGLHDIIVYPEKKELLLLIRYGLVGPFMIFTLLYLFYGKSHFFKQVIYSFATVVVGIGISLVIFLTEDPRQLYYTGLILVILFTYAVSGLRLKFSAVASLSVSCIFIILGLVLKSLPAKVVFNDLFGLISVNIIGTLAGYLMERSRRNEFLYKRQSEKDRRALEEANAQLRYLSYHDPLTGLYNRRAFDEHLKAEWQRAIRHRYPVSLLMMDIDDFKKYNDTQGHIAGDRVLRRIADVIKLMVNRPGDMVARYGGEEFVVLLVGTVREGAIYLAEEILSKVRELQLPHPDTDRRIVTISIGCTTTVPSREKDLTEFIRCADEALYRAKSEGKDRFCCMD